MKADRRIRCMHNQWLERRGVKQKPQPSPVDEAPRPKSKRYRNGVPKV